MKRSTRRSLDTVYNTEQSTETMLETQYLFQPRGPGTAWHFRMKTPHALIGHLNPLTNKPFPPGETRIGLRGTRNLKEARLQRDQILALIRRLEAERLKDGIGTIPHALEIAEEFNALPDEPDDEQRSAWLDALADEAKQLASLIGKKSAGRWYRVATGQEIPKPLLRDVFEDYRAKRKKPLGLTSINNLRTAEREFLAFAGEEIELPAVTRSMARRFAEEYLPNQKNAKAPEGQGPATIRKKITLLRGVWRWARKTELLPFDHPDPWDDIGPSHDEIEEARAPKRFYEPSETVRLFAAKPEGTTLGDLIRVALLTGVRLEEVASLQADQVDRDARWYVIQRSRRNPARYKGKTANAQRIVPLVDVAQAVIRRRLEEAQWDGPLFPELRVRKSNGRRGSSVSTAFTRLRRRVLGRETDHELDLHSFRRTWRTAARRAKINEKGVLEMGGWARVKSSDNTYDFGLEAEQYREEQEKVARWLRSKGYLA